MEVYHLKVRNLGFRAANLNIVGELEKLHEVKFVALNMEKSEIKIILGELGSIIACKSVLKALGYTDIQISS